MRNIDHEFCRKSRFCCKQIVETNSVDDKLGRDSKFGGMLSKFAMLL